jgi:hypothetical protein
MDIGSVVGLLGGDAAGKLVDVLKVAVEHIKKKHGKELSGAKPDDLGEWILAGVMCGVKRMATGGEHCPHEVGPHGTPA